MSISMLKRFSLSLIIFSIVFCGLYAKQPEIQIEPPFWINNLKNDTVQLMVYGPDICKYNFKLQDNRVDLIKKHNANNCNYVFLDVKILENQSEFEFVIQIDQRKEKYFYTYQIKEKRTPERINGFDQSDAIYLITPDRFSDGDSTNNNVQGYTEKANRNEGGGRHGGDLKGIKQHLDYIQNLGFTSIWLNPILENNMEKYSYHGYSCTNYYKVDPRFGSNLEYQEFVEKAHAKDLKVIMDMIVNHCGLEHWWIDDLPFENWLNTWDSYTETSHQKLTLQDPNASDYDKKVYTDGWFVPTMPDLNQRNPFLERYLIQNAIWWTDYLGLNGIRMDTYSYSDKDFMNRWVDALMKEFPGLSIVGEEWNENASVISFWMDGKKSQTENNSNLEFLMDFPLTLAMPEALNEDESWGKGLIKIYQALAKDFQYPSPENLLIFPDNHDMPRLYSLLNEDLEHLKIATAIYLTTRGIPQFYYGTEILMTSPVHRDDGKIRSDFPGGWKGDPVNAFNDEELNEDQLEFKNYLTDLLKWRKTANLVHKGQLTHFVPFDGFYVYFRHQGDDALMVIVNKNIEQTELKLNRFNEFLSSYKSGVNVIDENESYDIQESISVPPKMVTILKLEK